MPVRTLGLAPATLFATLRREAPQRYPVWLDSAVPGALGRTSILAACPQQTLVLWGDGRVSGGAVSAGAGFTGALDAWWRQVGAEADPAAAPLPFRGGWILYLSYE